MSRVNRHRPSGRLGERVEFNFCSLCAVQVPVVSDRLLLSIISVDTGKTIARSSKAAARNGICQWPDSILESIWFSRDEVSKEYEDCRCRIVVSMGSTRGAILGEVFLNLNNYLSSDGSTAISLPLKKCNSGTILQLKIQCLGTKSKSSPRNDDMDNKSDGSNSLITRNAHFSSRNDLGGFHQDEVGIRDSSFSPSQRNDSDGGLYIESSQTSGQNMLQESIDESSLSGFNHLSSGASGSSKDLLDAAEETIEELLIEAQMWESHYQKLKIDLEKLQKESDEKSKNQTEILLELSASQAEQESLRQEIEELKLSLKVATERQTVGGISKSGDAIDVQFELKDEVHFLRESNENLTMQLKKSQDANIELVSILQELEETIEAQRTTISNFTQMSNMIDQDIPTNALSAQEDAEWERKMSLKEDEIIALREKLDRVLSIENPGGVGSDAIYLELEKENDFLKVKMQDLENDCSELTEENLELIHKLKEVSGVEEQDSCLSDIEVMLNATGLSGTSKSRAKYLERKCADLEQKMLNFQSESRELEEKLKKSHEDLKGQTLELSELRENLSRFRAMELERGEINFSRGYQLRSEELGDIETELKLLKSTVQLKEKEIEGLQHSKLEMETFIDSVLGPKIHELEIYKVELELHISRLEDEKIELLESISGMEVELTNLTSEYESCIVQMDDSRTMIIDLKDKVERNQMELEAQKVELKKKQLEFQKIFLEAQDDSEALRRLNAKLQAKVHNLTEEYNSLQELTDDLKKEKLELHSFAKQLEQKLEHSKRRTTDFCTTVDLLEVKLSSIQKDISLKEQSFLLELDNIFHEHKDHEEKINRAHFLLNKIDKEKAIEIENLEREVISLTAQLSSTHGEQASSMVDTIREASILRADKAKLQANLHDVNEQLRHYESLLEDIHKESKRKIKSLTDSLNVSKQNEEMLKIDAEAVRRLMEAAKSNEENLRITSNELELKYKSSDYEKQQIMEENYGLKIQVRKIAGVQDELLEVQSSLDEAQFEKERLEGILRLISEECDELKVQNAMLTDKVSMMQDTSNNIIEEKQTKTSMQTKMSTINEGNNDLATDNRGCCLVNEEPDLQVKVQSLESGLAEVLEKNSMYMTQVKSPTTEQQAGSRNGEGNNDDKIAHLESELKYIQDKLLNMSLQYAEVEAQREELVMELKNVNAKKGGRWF
ncbi:paramyosin isoform X1 [Zea mays]|uniref:Myosin heavy chain-related protein n=4 Tax=Zea mays TaxID=4577 RepID=A0A1D6P7D9_MAIZE|nr:paramyosin isoform X1 [Zea mays]XP_008659975.1 paramyosin isoform X1 [Zea mays]XP_008659976.1 paramyosin isoform X1 [Zea mays]AQL05751.1 Myosin heavy chain-related protein [Zea mays]AQL05757.1 Myosin heavy chain-related protein [Zea mays]AQL05759.1 Myosin heavy chain-related protein [Zea mays]AQL05760.1 Myosin heavy chain-related protein [Zea mays]|eukprot:XP_008659974.1 paramyosin isoform X1 [Zea mays]